MDKEYWLICNQCGYSKKVYSKEEVFDEDTCPLCQGKLIYDMNAGRKIEEPTGDNFPKFDKEKQAKEFKRLEQNLEDKKLQEQEIKNSINMIGDSATWEMIEAIGDAKLRLRYRLIFLKIGGIIPEKENDI